MHQTLSQPNEQGGTSNKFEVLEPDPGEFLVVLAVVSTKAGEAPQLPTGYDLKIERDQ